MSDPLYWRRDYFQFLRTAAEWAAERERFGDFREYCVLMEKGLRKQALDALRRFVNVLQRLPVDHRRAATIELLEFDSGGPWTASLIPHSLWHEAIRPTLEAWCDEAGDDPTPYFWLGRFTGDTHRLEEALQRQADHRDAAHAYVRLIDARVEIDVHELPVYYIGDPEEDLRLLQRAEELLSLLSAVEGVEDRRRSINQLQELVQSYVDYRRLDSGVGFEEWARRAGRPYQ